MPSTNELRFWPVENTQAAEMAMEWLSDQSNWEHPRYAEVKASYDRFVTSAYLPGEEMIKQAATQ